MPSRRADLTRVLNRFYQQPVAVVSFELLVTLGAILFFAIFAVRPTLLTMTELLQEIEEKQKLDEDLSQKIAALATAQAELTNNQAQLALLDEAIPTHPEVVTALKILEKIASDRQLAIVSMSINQVPSESMATASARNAQVPFNISVTVTGGYPAIRQFINDITGVRRVFRIDSVTFTTNDTDGIKTLNAIINLNIPYGEPS